MAKTSWIECRNTNQKGIIGFYLLTGTEEYFLFTQKYRHSIWNRYHNGIRYEEAISYSKSHHDNAIAKVIQKIRMHMDYFERTGNVLIPERRRSMTYHHRNEYAA